jgi:hypothetical protein
MYAFFSREYLDDFAGRTVEFDIRRASRLGDMLFTNVRARRRLEEDAANGDPFDDAMRGILHAAHAAHGQAGFFLAGIDGRVSVFCASNALPAFSERLANGIPGIELGTRPLSPDILHRTCAAGGVITGAPAATLTGSEIDGVIDAMGNDNYLLAILARPLPDRTVGAIQDALRDYRDEYERNKSTEHVYGVAAKRTITETFPVAEKLSDLLASQLKRVAEGKADGFWRCCVWFAGENRETAAKLARNVCGAYMGESGDTESPRHFFTTDLPFRHGMLAIPDLILTMPADAPAAGAEEGFYEIAESLTTIRTTRELSAYFRLPTRPHNGFDALDTKVASDSAHAFNIYPPELPLESSFEIGSVEGSGAAYRISYQKLKQHLLVTGATRNGKTNTVSNILCHARRRGVPFVVIETAKKEYWRLSDRIDDLRVYSAGGDALPLRLNPFEPERGVCIGNHIDELICAFNGAFEMESPVSAALKNLFVHTYRAFGWDPGARAGDAARPYPTVGDALQLLQGFVESELHYGAEVQSNIRGAIENRLRTLTYGPVGNAVNTGEGASAESFFQGSTVIELDDLSTETRAFMANLLLIKMNQYLRRAAQTDSLRNIVVLEEAHNVFTNINESAPASGSKAIASNYFSNLLSEISAYGTAMIIADQNASKVNVNAISNTAIKIAHVSTLQENIDALSAPLRLSDYQRRMFPALGVGEAVIGVSGERAVCKVKIGYMKSDENAQYACIMCKGRASCRRNEMSALLDARASDLPYAGNLLLSLGGDPPALRNAARDILASLGGAELRARDRLCLLGLLLERVPLACSDIEKRRIVATCNVQ